MESEVTQYFHDCSLILMEESKLIKLYHHSIILTRFPVFMGNLAFPISKTRMSLLLVSKCLTNKGPVYARHSYVSSSQVRLVIVALPNFVNLKISKHHHPPWGADSHTKSSLLQILKSTPKGYQDL